MQAASSAENENKALIRRWFEEIWNNGRVDMIHDFRAPDAAATGFGAGGSESRGPAPFQAFYANMRAAFPDLHVHLHDIIAEGDRVAVRLTLDGTHLGTAFGAAPTGRKVSLHAMVLVRMADGKIAEAWNNIDRFGILREIGALPEHLTDDFLTRPS